MVAGAVPTLKDGVAAAAAAIDRGHAAAALETLRRESQPPIQDGAP
jgi:anthranilate phosphoribosyltransferase